MASSAPPLAVGLAQFGAAALVPAAAFWLLLNAGRVGRAGVALGRRCGLLRPPAEHASGPTVERVAADLRRLAAAVRSVQPGTSQTRRRGLQMAYDDTLVVACQVLGVPHDLHAIPEGIDRGVERLRVEQALEDAGLRFRPGLDEAA